MIDNGRHIESHMIQEEQWFGKVVSFIRQWYIGSSGIRKHYHKGVYGEEDMLWSGQACEG